MVDKKKKNENYNSDNHDCNRGYYSVQVKITVNKG